MGFTLTIPAPSLKLVVTVGASSLTVDLARFNFGDGHWLANIQGDDVFS